MLAAPGAALGWLLGIPHLQGSHCPPQAEKAAASANNLLWVCFFFLSLFWLSISRWSDLMSELRFDFLPGKGGVK